MMSVVVGIHLRTTAFSILHFRHIHTENKEVVHGFSFKAQLWTAE